jgi:hypothetical protein
MYLRWARSLSLFSALCYPATFGTVVPVIDGASGLVLDEARVLPLQDETSYTG